VGNNNNNIELNANGQPKCPVCYLDATRDNRGCHCTIFPINLPTATKPASMAGEILSGINMMPPTITEGGTFDQCSACFFAQHTLAWSRPLLVWSDPHPVSDLLPPMLPDTDIYVFDMLKKRQEEISRIKKSLVGTAVDQRIAVNAFVSAGLFMDMNHIMVRAPRWDALPTGFRNVGRVVWSSW
jgi:hypothetical protein